MCPYSTVYKKIYLDSEHPKDGGQRLLHACRHLAAQWRGNASNAKTTMEAKEEEEAKDALAFARAQPSTRPLFLMKATAEWVITRPDKTTAYSFWHCGRASQSAAGAVNYLMLL